MDINISTDAAGIDGGQMQVRFGQPIKVIDEDKKLIIQSFTIANETEQEQEKETRGWKRRKNYMEKSLEDNINFSLAVSLKLYI